MIQSIDAETMSEYTQHADDQIGIILERKLADGSLSHLELTRYLVNNHYEPIKRLALSVVKSHDEAEDVAQRTLIQVVNRIDQYRSIGSFRSWVLKIGFNEARMLLRRRNAQSRLKRLIQLQLSQTTPPPQPESLLIQHERDQALWLAVAQLKERLRLPILLRYRFDLSDQEIGDVLSISHAAVRTRLHRAHKQLLHLLKETPDVARSTRSVAEASS